MPQKPRCASLIAPAKLATLGERQTNRRVQKCVYLLASPQQAGEKPAKVLDQAVERARYTNRLPAKLTEEALLRNLDIAGKIGCLDAEGMSMILRHPYWRTQSPAGPPWSWRAAPALEVPPRSWRSTSRPRPSPAALAGTCQLERVGAPPLFRCAPVAFSKTP